jgi:hypothetical protein
MVTGYSTAVGPHTLTAAATDAAGNTATETRSYTVTGYTLFGFYAPVQMGGALNSINAGSTAPLKYEVFLGGTELTSTSVVASTTATPISCCYRITMTTVDGSSLIADFRLT